MKTFTNNNYKDTMAYLWKCLLIVVVTAAAFFAVTESPGTAYADFGPKPSVNITFVNMGDELCYGTLLSKRSSTGPFSAWNGEYEHNPEDLTNEIWEAFVQYEDTDGYYFLQAFRRCDENKSFVWGYYPPTVFKILLYYPESDTFVVSESYESYAFNSYYTVNMDGISGAIEGASPILTAEESYNYTREALGLVCRIVVTILLEIGIALLFGFKKKKLLGVITVTNIATQILLNVALNVIRFYNGALIFLIFFVLFEIAVFIIEAIVYGVAFNKVSSTRIPLWKPVLYAFVANLLSFVAGFAIAALEM
ncbi:hypothetical protein EOM82_07960 [bacterium]|nr:hypothetical protein [bacterium]